MKNIPKTIVLLFVIIAAASALLLLYFSEKPTAPKQKLFFSDKPENWIYDNPSTMDEDVKIDVFMATEGKTRLEKSQQDYFSDNDIESFFYSGMYKGQQFKSEYLPPDFFNITRGMTLTEKRKKADEMAKIQIMNEFKANDGKIHGFVLGKMENEHMVFYIFVDEDWKSQLKFTNIVWGDNFNDIGSLNERPFDFSKNQDGVYIDKLSSNVDWYKQKVRKGGIIVGEINKEILSAMLKGEEYNITYTMVR